MAANRNWDKAHAHFAHFYVAAFYFYYFPNLDRIVELFIYFSMRFFPPPVAE